MFSRFINWLFWRYNSDRRDGVDIAMVGERKNLLGLDDVRRLMHRFSWIPEPIEWQPTVEVVFARYFTGDCQSAAALGAWALKQIHRPAHIYTLSSRVSAHAVAISDDCTVMVSNNDVVELPMDWHSAVLTYFDNRYTGIKRA
jgi:hypothetical protein